MDGSFLSDDQVVTASREFVCIRLATYENKEETDFLTNIFVGHDGELQNTVFAILSPDGKRPLVRSGRGPHFAFRSASDMATQMKTMLAEYSSADLQHVALPAMQSLDLALNVAACDQLPVVAIVTEDGKLSATMKQKLARLLWGDELIGQFCAAIGGPNDLRLLSGVTLDEGIFAVAPGPFGMQGTVLKSLPLDAPTATIRQELANQAKLWKPTPKDYAQHIRMGTQMGLDWETTVPVTDQQSLDAKQRYRQRMQTN